MQDTVRSVLHELNIMPVHACLPPRMTEESRHIQLTNQINFVPALCGPSNMNESNSSLVDNHSTKCKPYIDMDD